MITNFFKQPLTLVIKIWVGSIVAMALFGQNALALKDGDTFGDWTARCQEAQGKPKVCIITQLVNDKKSKQPVIAVQIAIDPLKKQPPIAEIKTPLLVALQGGIGVKIDNDETMGIPSHNFRSVLEEVKLHIRAWVPVISLTKGLELATGMRMTEVISEVLPGHPVTTK